MQAEPLNTIPAVLPATYTVPSLLGALAREFGLLLAIRDQKEGATFADLEELSRRLAGALLDAGVGEGARIGIPMPNGQDYLIALLATLRIGATAVLISTLSLPPELAQMIRSVEVDILLSVEWYLRHDHTALIEAAFRNSARRPTSRSSNNSLRSI